METLLYALAVLGVIAYGKALRDLFRLGGDGSR